MSDLLQIVDEDPVAITADMIAQYELMTGKTLYPAQVERLQIDLFAYRESLARAAMNQACRQMLVKYSTAPVLDYLGDLVGVRRAAATPAITRMRVVFSAPLASALIIPSGTRFESGSGQQFESVAECIAPAGAVSVETAAQATIAGAAGTGLLPGQINVLIDELPADIDSVSNTILSVGGSDAQSDERLRELIKLAPESFTTAGSRGAYRYHALQASASIVDAAVKGPELRVVNGLVVSVNGVQPGVVQIFPLTDSGLPSPALLQIVELACSVEKVRPLTDFVEVLPPIEYSYSIVARLKIYDAVRAEDVLPAAIAAARAFSESRANSLGQDVVPSQVVAALSMNGVYQVDLLSLPVAIVVPEEGWAHCVAIDVQIVGAANG